MGKTRVYDRILIENPKREKMRIEEIFTWNFYLLVKSLSQANRTSTFILIEEWALTSLSLVSSSQFGDSRTVIDVTH